MLSVEIKKILKELKSFKKDVIIVGVSGLLAGGANASLAYMLKHIIDALTASDIALVKMYALYALGLSLVATASRYFHIFTMNYISECIGQRYRQLLLARFLKLNLNFHNTFDSGSGGMLSRILADAGTIQTSLRMVADIFLHPIQLISSLVFLFYLDWKLTFCLFIAVPFLALFHRSITKSLRKYIPIGQRQIEYMTSTIKEALDGVRIIQAYNLEDKINKKLQLQSFDYIETRKKVHSRIEITGPFSEFLATSLILSVMVYVSYEVASGRSTAGTLIAYIGSIMTLSPAIKKIQENMVRIQELRASAKRVYDILDDHREVPKALQPVPFPSSWNEIQFKNISFSYGDRPILKDVSLTIRRGEKIALVGESGSGKSTILNLMERFYDPQKGSVMIDNVSIDQFELQDLRNQMALVSQDVFLFRDSVAENITVTKPEATTEQIREAALRANAEIFIQRLENKYETKVGDRGGLLSGGEKQRISIARAILKNADILLLDEATSALDSESEKEVQKSLDEAIVGKTSIIVSHRLSTIQNVDRIYVMSHGQIVESGRHQELVDKKGIYFKLWTIQSMN